MRAGEAKLTNEIDAPLRAKSSLGTAYVNEGNLEEPNWQEAFWGKRLSSSAFFEEEVGPKRRFPREDDPRY
ncbi:hypothetical protein BDV96DRAFT_644859 [Lophiotrema nucula]|uniref:Uncharacterized protein n=1 Tax=Lophiotrema nucula TaxID=690887 RepID=A0A6A5ZD45_9PLEO|nr:hypothetical protein BDV96DRAFT_644859 [Lophiotrema nucula]